MPSSTKRKLDRHQARLEAALHPTPPINCLPPELRQMILSHVVSPQLIAIDPTTPYPATIASHTLRAVCRLWHSDTPAVFRGWERRRHALLHAGQVSDETDSGARWWSEVQSAGGTYDARRFAGLERKWVREKVRKAARAGRWMGRVKATERRRAEAERRLEGLGTRRWERVRAWSEKFQGRAERWERGVDEWAGEAGVVYWGSGWSSLFRLVDLV